MTDTDIAWAAGFIDGEGNFSITWSGTNLYCLVQAANTDRRPLEKLVALFGGKIYVHSKGNDRHAVSYKWRTVAAGASAAAEKVLPYLMVKSEQAKIVIEFQKLVRRKIPGFNRALSDEEFKARAECFTRLAALNRRGPSRGVLTAARNTDE